MTKLKREIFMIHNLIKKIFKTRINKLNSTTSCDNNLLCIDCGKIDSIDCFDWFDNQIIFYCNYCWAEIPLQKAIEHYKYDLYHFCLLMSACDENLEDENYNKKNVYDHFVNIFQNCIKLDYKLFCSQYYIDILIIFNKNKLLFENYVVTL